MLGEVNWGSIIESWSKTGQQVISSRYSTPEGRYTQTSPYGSVVYQQPGIGVAGITPSPFSTVGGTIDIGTIAVLGVLGFLFFAGSHRK